MPVIVIVELELVPRPTLIALVPLPVISNPWIVMLSLETSENAETTALQTDFRTKLFLAVTDTAENEPAPTYN